MNTDPGSGAGTDVNGADDRDPNWGRRLGIAGALVFLLVIGGLITSATVPRWWAQRVGDQVNGSITQGVLVGLFYGFVFTLLPLVILALVLRWRRTWRWVVAGLLLALLAAAPNLMTLGIVLGSGNAAHAGERTLDVQAPAFRGASLAGALLGVALALFVVYLLLTRRRARARERDVQARLGESTAAVTESPVDDL